MQGDNNSGSAGRFQITEVRVKLTDDPRNKLKAYCSVTIDDAFVVRDLKIIEGNKGPFVAMPSRKLCDRCTSCGGKNHLRARFCNDCGRRLRTDRGGHDERGRMRLYADIAHPIHQDARDFVEDRVLTSFHSEIERSKQAGYVAQSFEDLDYESYDRSDEGHR